MMDFFNICCSLVAKKWYLPNNSIVKDAVSDAIFRYSKCGLELNKEEKLSWHIHTADNIIKDELKKKMNRNKREILLNDESLINLLAYRGDFCTMDEIEFKMDCEFAMRGLTEKQHKIFNLWLDGMKQEEIADELNITTRTVKRRIKEIKIKLKIFFTPPP